MRSTEKYVCLLILLFAGSCFGGQIEPSKSDTEKEDAFVWMKRMSAAFKEKSYEGRFIYSSNGHLNALRVIHTNKQGKEFERLTHLNGSGEEIVRRGSELICLHPEGGYMRLENSIPTGLFANKFSSLDQSLRDLYHLTLQGTGRVAGREADRYLLTPVDEYRYGYKLWIDQKSSLLLKSVMHNPAGEILETFEFISIEVDIAIDDLAFEFDSSVGLTGLRILEVDGNMSADVNDAWLVQWVPEGFSMAGCDVRRLPVNESLLDSLVYTDGINSFTVFIEMGGEHTGKMGQRQQGATAAFSRKLEGVEQAVFVTVVGELPMIAIKKIAESVRKN